MSTDHDMTPTLQSLANVNQLLSPLATQCERERERGRVGNYALLSVAYQHRVPKSSIKVWQNNGTSNFLVKILSARFNLSAIDR